MRLPQKFRVTLRRRRLVLHLVEQQIYLLLHPQDITRFAFFDFFVRYAPPPVCGFASAA